MELTRDIIELSNKKELDKLAKEAGIKGYSRTTKEDLQAKLLELLENINEPVQEEKAAPLVFFEKVSQMTDVQEVEQACLELRTELKLDSVQPKTQSNYLAPYSKLFKTLQPTPDTAHLFFPFKAKGKSEYIQRHKFFEFTNHADIDWDKTNQDIKVRRQVRQSNYFSKDELADALNAKNKVFILDMYLKTMCQLLNSNDPYELGVGLIAASGRRPSEILILSEFEISEWIPSYIKNPEYGVKVHKLAKKRDKEVTTYTPLLVPASDFVKRLEYFRSLPEIKAYKKAYTDLLALGWDKEATWKKIEAKAGLELRKVTDFYFDFLPKIDDEENRKNIVLRACTIKLLTLRDYPEASQKAKITYAGVVAGHIIPEILESGKVSYHGNTSASTLNYDDYEPNTSDIPFLSNVLKVEEPPKSIIQEPSTTEIKEVENMGRIAELEAKVLELETLLAQKDAEIVELKESMVSKPKLPPMEVTEMDNSRLFSTRKVGSPDEKLNRVWQAITAYNGNTPEYRIAPTSKVLRELSGVNGQAITKWMESHKDEIETHCHQYDMGEMFGKTDAGKDKSNYYNNRYRNKTDMNIEMVLETIEKQYLMQVDGV